MKLYLIDLLGAWHIVFEYAAGKYQHLASAQFVEKMQSKLAERGIAMNACNKAEPAPTAWLKNKLECSNWWNMVYEPLTLSTELSAALHAPCKLQAPQKAWHVEKLAADFQVVYDNQAIERGCPFDEAGTMAPAQ